MIESPLLDLLPKLIYGGSYCVGRGYEKVLVLPIFYILGLLSVYGA